MLTVFFYTCVCARAYAQDFLCVFFLHWKINAYTNLSSFSSRIYIWIVFALLKIAERHEEKERKPEVASELIIIVYKHKRHFSFFLLLLLFSTTKQIIYVDTIFRSLFFVHVCLIGSKRIVTHKQKNLINSYWTTSKFPFYSSISSFLIGVKYLIYTISYGYIKAAKARGREREHRFSSDIT